MRRAHVLLLCAPLLCSSCLSVRWTRTRIDEHFTAEQIASVQTSRDDLGSCLSKLGAPNFVQRAWGDQMELIWLWRDTSGWSVTLSYQVTDYVSPSLSYEQEDLTTYGLRLRFDANWRLVAVRTGTSHDLLRDPGRERSGERHRRIPLPGPFDRPF